MVDIIRELYKIQILYNWAFSKNGFIGWFFRFVCFPALFGLHNYGVFRSGSRRRRVFSDVVPVGISGTAPATGNPLEAPQKQKKWTTPNDRFVQLYPAKSL